MPKNDGGVCLTCGPGGDGEKKDDGHKEDKSQKQDEHELEETSNEE